MVAVCRARYRSAGSPSNREAAQSGAWRGRESRGAIDRDSSLNAPSRATPAPPLSRYPGSRKPSARRSRQASPAPFGSPSTSACSASGDGRARRSTANWTACSTPSRSTTASATASGRSADRRTHSGAGSASGSKTSGHDPRFPTGSATRPRFPTRASLLPQSGRRPG